MPNEIHTVETPVTRQYIGARYVPIFDGAWDNTKDYAPLTVVSHEGNSYTSRTYVPSGIAITNETYWALSGNYNAQVEAYRQEVIDYTSEFNERIHDDIFFYFPSDVNSGDTQDASFLLVINKRCYLFDCGRDASIVTYYQYLLSNNVFENLDGIFISHYHADHVANLSDILAAIPHANCKAYLPMNFAGYYSGSELDTITENREEVISTLTSANIEYTEVNSVRTIELDGGVNITLLNSTPTSYNYYKTIGTTYYNNYSMVSKIVYGNTINYYLADIQGDAELYMVDNYELESAYMCVINHHGEQWDDVVSFMNKLSPYIGIMLTNTDERAGVFPKYNIAHLYTTRLGSINVSENTTGGVIDGIEVFDKGESTSLFRFYVDNTYVGESNGDVNHPYKTIEDVLEMIPNKKTGIEYSIYIKGTATPYDTLTVVSKDNNLLFRMWDTAPTIKGLWIERCDNINIHDIIFSGLQTHDENYSYIGRISSSNVDLTRCIIKSENTTKVRGLNLLNCDVILQSCEFDTLSLSYETTLRSTIFAMNTSFKNVTYCYPLASTDLTIRGLDTIDENVTYYLFAGASTLMTLCNIELPNTVNLSDFEALCSKNTDQARSNYFKHGDYVKAVVGKYVITSSPVVNRESVTDLDNAKVTGIYICNGSATNLPSGISVGGCILVMALDFYNPENVTQIFFARNSLTMYIRQLQSGTWTSWTSLTPT